MWQETKREARSALSDPSNMIYSSHAQKKSSKMHGRAGGGAGRIRGGGEDLMMSFSNRDLRMLEVRQDYDFNRRPDNPADPGQPLNCNISVNLRNVLQVVRHSSFLIPINTLASMPLVKCLRYRLIGMWQNGSVFPFPNTHTCPHWLLWLNDYDKHSPGNTPITGPQQTVFPPSHA